MLTPRWIPIAIPGSGRTQLVLVLAFLSTRMKQKYHSTISGEAVWLRNFDRCQSVAQALSLAASENVFEGNSPLWDEDEGWNDPKS